VSSTKGAPEGSSGPAVPATITPATHLDASLVHRWIAELERRLRSAEAHLTELDAAIGDADHGANMTRGARAAVAALADTESPAPPAGQPSGADTAESATAAGLVKAIGHSLSRSIGGASGPLYGTWFSALGRSLPESDATPLELATALRAALEAVQHLGAAEVGDKTMVDALAPASRQAQEVASSGADLAGMLRIAAGAAEDGAIATIPLRARRGRASYLGARSEGHQDPGATSAAILLDALRTAAGA
jgi:phosphoenolpyruvate---glycerone phosphotransferase subunit DhaL